MGSVRGGDSVFPQQHHGDAFLVFERLPLYAGTRPLLDLKPRMRRRESDDQKEYAAAASRLSAHG